MRFLKNLVLLSIVLLLFKTTKAQTQSATLKVYFASGKSDLNAAARMRLDSLADSLANALRYELRISGHADNRGDSLGNAALSERRTTAVREFLSQKGIVVKNTLSLGDRKPRADNADPEGQAQNRRVEIAVRFVPKPVPQVVEDSASKTTMADLYALLQDPPQSFCINPTRDTFLRCKDGTTIYVKAASFRVDAPCSQQCVTLKVKEVFDKSSMIFENLSTTSNGRILESKGMVHTELLDCQGRKLELLPGKAMVVSLPSNSSSAGFQIFDGQWLNGQSSINWIVNPDAKFSPTRLNSLAPCPVSGGMMIGEAERCRFFFCQIRNFFKKEVKDKSQQRTRVVNGDPCGKVLALLAKFGIQDQDAFLSALNFELLDSLGYSSTAEMLEKMDPAQLEATLMKFGKTFVPRSEYQYNIFNSTKTGWANCDAFQALPPSQLTDVRIKSKEDATIDCKLIFKRNILIAGTSYKDMVYFRRVQKGQPATLLALKYENGRAFLARKEVVTDAIPFELEFVEYSVKDLKAELKKLDFSAS